MMLLDIGSGVGAIQHLLLKSGVTGHQCRCLNCVSECGKEEAIRREIGDRINFHQGNFEDIIDDISNIGREYHLRNIVCEGLFLQACLNALNCGMIDGYFCTERGLHFCVTLITKSLSETLDGGALQCAHVHHSESHRFVWGLFFLQQLFYIS